MAKKAVMQIFYKSLKKPTNWNLKLKYTLSEKKRPIHNEKIAYKQNWNWAFAIVAILSEYGYEVKNRTTLSLIFRNL